MERRRESRLRSKQPVTVTVLGQLGASTIQATVLDISSNGMRLLVPGKILRGAGIIIESKNALVLAEVARCVREGDSYAIAVTLLHSLSLFKDLEILNRALFGEERNRGEVDSPARTQKVALDGQIRGS